MLKRMIKKIIFKEQCDSETYIRYLRKIGMNIGDDCTIYAPRKTVIDEQYPWMISIGNHVRITEGVILLTHDYSWSVLKRYGELSEKGAILGAAGKIEIGNNVFIGMNTIVLRGTKIGNNVIVGAGSVVSKDCESNWVYAGNPARKIMPVSDFYMKRKEKQLIEAKNLAISYYKRFNKVPPKQIFHEFFMLFENDVPTSELFKNKMELCGNFDDSINYIRTHKSCFKSYEDFIKYCFEDVSVYVNKKED